MPTETSIQTTPAANVARKEMIRGLVQLAGMLPVLILICILFSLLAANFWTVSNGVNVVRQASINIVLAAGMTFVILTGGIDLAVGSVLGVTAVLALWFSLVPGLTWAAMASHPTTAVTATRGRTNCKTSPSCPPPGSRDRGYRPGRGRSRCLLRGRNC